MACGSSLGSSGRVGGGGVGVTYLSVFIRKRIILLKVIISRIFNTHFLPFLQAKA